MEATLLRGLRRSSLQPVWYSKHDAVTVPSRPAPLTPSSCVLSLPPTWASPSAADWGETGLAERSTTFVFASSSNQLPHRRRRSCTAKEAGRQQLHQSLAVIGLAALGRRPSIEFRPLSLARVQGRWRARRGMRRSYMHRTSVH